ncbi:MAG: dihydroorotate dehydrogenase-like protein [Anaerolineaceae bacterium]|nr:MAG: dihydroorotate dehydrogenase-like protein [Anaerolineaceae bacterium]
MPDLTTTYLGLKLKSPLVASASPLSENLRGIRRLEDAGASAIVLYSLFEEQIKQEREATMHFMEYGTDSFAEALTYFPEPETYHAGPESYLELIRKAKASVDIPIIASLNGTSIGGWTQFAQNMQSAGADAIELNIYYIPSDVDMTGTGVENTYRHILTAVKQAVNIPVAVKLSPYFSNYANVAKQLVDAGADGLVMFNRFYQPDIDLETLQVKPNVLLSTPQDLRLPLRWIAMLYGRVDVDFAATSGIHQAEDVIKMMMVGASVTMMASALLKHGIDHLRTMQADLIDWMTVNEYVSIEQMRGSMSQINAEDPSAYERAQYARALSSYSSLHDIR